MYAQFTEDDLEKPVEDANGEVIGTVTAVEGDVARVEPRAGVMDSIRAAIGWTRTQENVSIRADAVGEITDEVIRLETESPKAGEAGAPAADGAESAAESTDHGPDGARYAARVESDEAATRGPEMDHLKAAERRQSAEEATTTPEAADIEGELEDELNRGTKVEPPAESEGRDALDKRTETAGGDTAETGDEKTESATEQERHDSPEAGSTAERSALAERRDPDGLDSREWSTDPGTTDVIDEPNSETSETDEGTDEIETEATDPGGAASEPVEDTGRETDGMDLAEELDRGSDLESAVEPAAESPERIETEEMALADELDRSPDLDAAREGSPSKAPDRDGEAQPTAEMDLAEELNQGVDLESAVETDHQEDAAVGDHEEDAPVNIDAHLGPQTDAEPTADTAAPRSREPASHAALEAEPALDHRTDELATDDADEAARSPPERGSIESPVEVMIDAQRTAIAQSQQLLEESLAVQQNVNRIALSAFRGQLVLQRQGLELVRAATLNSIEAADGLAPSAAAADRGQMFVRRLELVDGLDSMYRERLEDAGITTLDDLAYADAETVAEAAEVTEKRAERWIDQAAA